MRHYNFNPYNQFQINNVQSKLPGNSHRRDCFCDKFLLVEIYFRITGFTEKQWKRIILRKSVQQYILVIIS